MLKSPEKFKNFLTNFLALMVDFSKKEEFLSDWKALKQERDKLADKIAKVIESDPKIKERYESYCEALKDPRKLSSFL